MKGNLGNLMQQAQKVQEEMKKVQDDLVNMEIIGESGAGIVKVVMTGKHDVKKLHIDDSLMSEDKEVLEDLICAAINDAVRKVESESQERMGGVATGMGLPPGFKMPF